MFEQPTFRRQHGAITIQVAFALIALLGFTTFVVDYGVMWVSRRQAQNAADAGALAGAIGLLKDGGPAGALLSAHHFAANNLVWGQGNSAANVDVTFSGPSVSIPPCGTAAGCVRVDVMRNEPDRAGVTRGAALPTYFGQLVGIGSQGVRATATAQAGPGNMIRCLLPFAVIDRWSDNTDTNKDTTFFSNDGATGIAGWSPNDNFEPPSLGGTDVYVGPYGNNPSHTGWKVSQDYGRQLILKDGSPGNYSAGWANEVDLPDSTGSSDYKWNIQNCNEQPVGIATSAEACSSVNEAIGCVSVKTGVSQGPTSQGIGDLTKGLVGQDSAAHWSWSVYGGPNGQAGGVVDASGALNMESPRIRPIVIIDINNYIGQGCSGSTCIAKVANIVGFFAEGMCKDVVLDPGMGCDDPNKDVVGRIVTIPGSMTAGIGTVDTSAAFIEVVRLVR
jgi:hypothetical protein